MSPAPDDRPGCEALERDLGSALGMGVAGAGESAVLGELAAAGLTVEALGDADPAAGARWALRLAKSARGVDDALIHRVLAALRAEGSSCAGPGTSGGLVCLGGRTP